MRKCTPAWLLTLLVFLLTMNHTGCSKDDKETDPADTLDPGDTIIPKFVSTNYIELDKIYRISKFRSAVGHDYSDSYEHCRSMKHYFEPRGNVDWATVKIYSPVSGSISRVETEWAGTKIEIVSDDHPEYRFSIFHFSPLILLTIGDHVQAGEQLGTHIGSQTMSDISVIMTDATQQIRMISFFEVMTDALFHEFSDRGISTREEMIISEQERDENPLTCSGETFTSTDPLGNWVILN